MSDVVAIFERLPEVKFLADWLKDNFTVRIVEVPQVVDIMSVVSQENPELLITNSLHVAAIVATAKPTFLTLNELDAHLCLHRHEHINLWRQHMSCLKQVKQIFVPSTLMAKMFHESFRVQCRIQTPYIPPQQPSTYEYIISNKKLPYHDEVVAQMVGETIAVSDNLEDIRRAKLYVHQGKASNELAMAACCAVPTLACEVQAELLLPGDQTIFPNASAIQWVQALRVGVRDYLINSQSVKKHSIRYNQMSELQDKIKQALKKHKPVNAMTAQMTCAEIQKVARKEQDQEELQRLVEARNRPRMRERPALIVHRQEDFHAIQNLLGNNDRVYLGVGGLGDAMLTIAACHADTDAKVVFGANGGTEDTIKKMFDVFGISVLLTPNFNSSFEGMAIFNYVTGHRSFKGMAHIPDRMNYGEWKEQTRKYIPRIVNRMPLISLLGKLDNPRHTRGIVGLAPSGSDKQSTWKQRWLSRDEYFRVVHRLIEDGYTVFSFGSERDMDFYGPYPNNNAFWFSSDVAMCYPTPKYPINIKYMMQAMNACESFTSVDTWFKTYTGLAGIPTKLIKSRYNGRSYNTMMDPSDYVFINPEIWNFQWTDVEQLM